jgi:hypothetical protein
MAKVEFLACKPEIEKLRNEGFSVSLIYDRLTEQGKIRMKSKNFYKYIKRFSGMTVKQKHLPLPSLPAVRSQTLPGNLPVNLSEPGTPFCHDPKAHDSDDFRRA